MNKLENTVIVAMEECGELTQALSKAMRFGIDDCHPVSRKSNIESIIEEYYQLQAIMEQFFEEQNIVLANYIDSSARNIDEIKHEKRKKVAEYMEYSKQKGRVE